MLSVCLSPVIVVSGFKEGHDSPLCQKMPLPSVFFFVFLVLKMRVQSDLKKKKKHMTLFHDLQKVMLSKIQILILQGYIYCQTTERSQEYLKRPIFLDSILEIFNHNSYPKKITNVL